MEDAAAWYERALAVLELDRAADEGARCDLEIAAGDALQWAGNTRHRELLIAAAGRARALSDAERLGRVALALSPPTGFGFGLGSVDDALVSVAEEALAGLGEAPGNDALRARVLAALAAELIYAPEPDRRRALCRDAIDVARRAGDVEALRDVLYRQQLANYDPDNLPERVALADELVAIGRDRGDIDAMVRGLLWRYTSRFESGEIEVANGALDEAEQLAIELRPPLYGWMVQYHRASQAVMAGHFELAERLVNDSVPLGEAAGYGFTASGLAMIVGTLVRFDQGRWVEARQTMADLSDATGMAIFRLGTAYGEAESGLLKESWATLDALDAAGHEKFPRDWIWVFSNVMKALSVAAIGDTTRATVLYNDLLPYEERNIWNSLTAFGPVVFVLALLARTLGRWDDADRHFERVGCDVRTHRFSDVARPYAL